MNALDELRLSRKQELLETRLANPGYSINLDLSWIESICEKGWLDGNNGMGSEKIQRCLSIFSEQGRLPYQHSNSVQRNIGACFYEGEEVIVRHLDELVRKRNSEEVTNKNGLQKDWVLDVGCGRGVALEDIYAYYGPVLNLGLIGNTLHRPDYQAEFAKRGIIIDESRPRFDYPNGPVVSQGEGYSLIMANWVVMWHDNKVWLVNEGRRLLNEDGLFPINYKHLIECIKPVDQSDNEIEDPKEYLDGEFKRLGWVKDEESGMLLIRRGNEDGLRLTYMGHLRYMMHE